MKVSFHGQKFTRAIFRVPLFSPVIPLKIHRCSFIQTTMTKIVFVYTDFAESKINILVSQTQFLCCRMGEKLKYKTVISQM